MRPTTPLSNSGPRARAFSGTSPPQSAKSTSDARLGHRPLGRDGVGIGGGRVRVDGHVDHGGDAARRGGQAAGRPSFPVVAPRRVEVHVGVDRAREHGQARGVDHPAAAPPAPGSVTVDDGAASDHDITRRAIDQASAYDQFGLHLTLSFLPAVSGHFVSIQ